MSERDRVPVEVIAGFTDPGSRSTYIYAKCVLCKDTLADDSDTPATLSVEKIIRLATEHYGQCRWLNGN